VSDKGYTYTPATPERIKEWHDTEGKWWADNSLKIIIVASVLQFSTLGMMGLTMYLIQLGVYQ